MDLLLFPFIILPFYIIFLVIYFKELISKKWFKIFSILYLILLIIFIIPIISDMITYKIHFLRIFAEIFARIGHDIFLIACIFFLTSAVIFLVNLKKYKRLKNKLIFLTLSVFILAFLSFPYLLLEYNFGLNRTKALKLSEFAQQYSPFAFQRYGIGRILNNDIKKLIVREPSLLMIDLKEYGGYKKLLDSTVSTQEMMCSTYHDNDDCWVLADLYLKTKQYEKAIDILQQNKKLQNVKNIHNDLLYAAYILNKDFDKAINYINENNYINEQTKNELISNIYLEQGDFENAFEYADKIPNCGKNIAKTKIYIKMGKDDDAKSEFYECRPAKFDYKRIPSTNIDITKERQHFIDEYIKKYN